MVPSPNRGGERSGNDESRRGWLGRGNGYHDSPASTPSRRCSAFVSDISDDIRRVFADDLDLFAADDDHDMMMPPPAQINGSAVQSIPASASASQLAWGGLSRSASGVDIKRRASQQKMKSLQREVDLALEYFHQETENELDHSDGDEYLDDHLGEKYQLVTSKGTIRGSGRSEECDDSLPGTALTSMATSMAMSADGTNYDIEFDDCQFVSLLSESETEATAKTCGELSMKHRTKSILSLPLSLLTSQAAMDCSDDEDGDDGSMKFDNLVAENLHRTNGMVDFNSSRSLRNAMEPFLAIARLRREEARQGIFAVLDSVMLPPALHGCASRRISMSSEQSFPIGSNYGVPYPALRNESSFLYDVDSFPLESVLAEALGVKDLSRIHIDHPLIKDKARLLATLQNRGRRRKFHHLFDSFVTSHVIPLLHSQALSSGVFYSNRYQLQMGRPQGIIYRYQAFPSISIIRPGECSTDPHCDIARGHSIGNISYHVPLTSTFGTNAKYTESRPGREDWHPLAAKSPGLGFQYDGARCLHFNLKNETDVTSVSLNFRIAITRAPDCGVMYDPNDQLCCTELLKDKFSLENPGFFDEVVVNVGHTPRSYLPGPLATKWRGGEISVIG